MTLAHRILPDVRYIRLLRGELVAVDAEDYDRLYGFPWRLMTVRRKGDGTVKARYAIYTVNARNVYMHRVIVAAAGGVWVDHIDGDGLNNTRCNLRISTPQQNAWNKRRSTNNKSGIKGVCWCKSRKKWRASIGAGNVKRWLGDYDDISDAAAAYAKASALLHGEFGRLA